MSDIEANQALGSVYVFNYFSEELEKLSVGGEKVNPKGIEPWSKGSGTETRYTPHGIAVPRSKTKGEVAGEFGLGLQPVRAEWPSEIRKVEVDIPGPESGVNLTEDMILLLSPYVAILLSPNGHLLAEPAKVQAV